MNCKCNTTFEVLEYIVIDMNILSTASKIYNNFKL
jgi:hypothetical protein